jgi:hypothetical protein
MHAATAAAGEPAGHRSRPLMETLEPRRLCNAAGWADAITNPFMPIASGTAWVYQGQTNGEPVKDRLVVQSYTVQIEGVTCTVVLDRVYTNGQLTEKTQDFFAQDVQGNVWYFGEISRELENGKVVSRQGSWEHGIDGAKAGIIMPAQPTVGQLTQQENAPGVAEDQAEVLTLHAHAQTPFARFNNCLETREFTSLEPDVTEAKYYAAGIGLVKSQSLTGESEVLKLTQFTR